MGPEGLYDWKRCDHSGIGQPGCSTCDPNKGRCIERARIEGRRENAAEVERLKAELARCQRLPELPWAEVSASIAMRLAKVAKYDQPEASALMAVLDKGKTFVVRIEADLAASRDREARLQAQVDHLSSDATREYLKKPLPPIVLQGDALELQKSRDREAVLREALERYDQHSTRPCEVCRALLAGGHSVIDRACQKAVALADTDKSAAEWHGRLVHDTEEAVLGGLALALGSEAFPPGLSVAESVRRWVEQDRAKVRRETFKQSADLAQEEAHRHEGKALSLEEKYGVNSFAAAEDRGKSWVARDIEAAIRALADFRTEKS